MFFELPHCLLRRIWAKHRGYAHAYERQYGGIIIAGHQYFNIRCAIQDWLASGQLSMVQDKSQRIVRIVIMKNIPGAVEVNHPAAHF